MTSLGSLAEVEQDGWARVNASLHHTTHAASARTTCLLEERQTVVDIRKGVLAVVVAVVPLQAEVVDTLAVAAGAVVEAVGRLSTTSSPNRQQRSLAVGIPSSTMESSSFHGLAQ